MVDLNAPLNLLEWDWLLSALLLVVLGGFFIYRRLYREPENAVKQLKMLEAETEEACQLARLGTWSRNFESGEFVWSKQAIQLLGNPSNTMLKHYEALVHPDDQETVVSIMARAYCHGGKYECEHRVICPDDSVRYLLLAGQVYFDEESHVPLHEVGTIQDITKRKVAEDKARQAETRFRAIFEAAPYSIVVVDAATGAVHYANQSTYALFELPLELDIKSFADLQALWVQSDDYQEVAGHIVKGAVISNHEVPMTTANGKQIWTMLSTTCMQYGGVLAVFVSMLDITEKKQIQEELRQLATTDSLTGIHNRRCFLGLAEKELLRAHRYCYPLSLLMLDLDHFKSINDKFGHLAGDNVLRHFSKIGQHCLRTHDVFARIGGEEFAVLLISADLEIAHRVAERIRSSLEGSAIVFEGQKIDVTVSIGLLANVGAISGGIEKALDYCDKALYSAKHSGRNQIVVWQPNQPKSVVEE